MYCLENMKRISYQGDLVMDLTKLYRFKGKDFYYEDVFKNQMNSIVSETIYKDCSYASKLLQLNVSENRTRLVLTKNSTPKTNDEKVLANLKTVFSIIQEKGEELELAANEFLYLADKLFKGIVLVGFRTEKVEVQFNLLREKKTISKRDDFDSMLTYYKSYQKNQQFETTQLATNFYVDVVNTKVFDKYNEFLSLIIYYCLLFKERFNVFKHYSFFEMYYNNLQEFEAAVSEASYDWRNGFGKTDRLNRLTIRLMLDAYQKIENKLQMYKFDKELSKLDQVATAILKLGEVFTKDEIRKQHPEISESTINRALEYLKKENMVRPNGTGRNATWLRITSDDHMDLHNKQASIFD